MTGEVLNDELHTSDLLLLSSQNTRLVREESHLLLLHTDALKCADILEENKSIKTCTNICLKICKTIKEEKKMKVHYEIWAWFV